MKKNWKPRLFLSLFITVLGLFGTWYASRSPFEEFIFQLILLGPIWLIIIYFLSGFIIKGNPHNSKNISSNKISTSTPKSPIVSPIINKPHNTKPTEKKSLSDKADEFLFGSDKEITSDEVEISDQEQQKLWNQVEVTPQEEEKLYEVVSKEVENNRREGIWTKALIEVDGDEKKAKLKYMKIRVELLFKETKEKKFNEIISTLIEKRKKHLNLEKIIDKEKNRRELFETAESNYWHSEVIDHYKIGKVRIRIFSHKDKKMDPYYWVKSVDEKNKYNRSFWKTKNLVIEDIRKHLEELLRENEESQKYWEGMTSKK